MSTRKMVEGKCELTSVKHCHNGTSKSKHIQDYSDDPFFRYRMTKQICLVLTWMSMAMVLEIAGTCIPDLMEKTGLNYEEISRAMIGTSVGLITASIFGGIIHERFYRLTDLFMALGSFIGAIGVFILPWMNSIWSLAIAFFCGGLEISLINPGGNAMVMHLWGERSGPPMYSLHFGFGIGGLLTPQIAKPFLSKHNLKTDTNYTTINSTTYNNTPNILVNPSLHQTGANNFVYAFVIIGVINVIVASSFFFLFIIGPPKGFPQREGAKSFKTLCTPKSCAPEGNAYSLGIITILFFFYIHVVGGEHIYGKWIFSYAIESDVSFTKSQAANLLSLFWLGHMTGRGSGMIFSKFVPTKVVIICDIFTIIVVATLLSLFGHKIPLLLWILTFCMGFLVAPVFPAGMLWTNMYLKVNSMSVMACMLGVSAGYFIYVYLGGFIIQNFGPRYMMVVQVMYGVGLLITFIFMEFLVRCFSNKHNPNKVKDEKYSNIDGKSVAVMNTKF